MAEEEKKETEEPEGAEGQGEDAPASSRKKTVLLGGGVLAVLALGAMAAFMALPKKEEVKLLEGPFVQLLFPENINVNLNETSRKRYLVFNLNGFYSCYEPEYLTARLADPLYMPLIRHAVVKIASAKTIDEIYGKVGGSVFEEEMREALNPIIFPVVIGSGTTPAEYDELSGLRPGEIFDSSTFGGLYHEHVLHVDGETRSLRLDDGGNVELEEGQREAVLRNAAGEELIVDVSRLKEEFAGDVPVGVQGFLQQIHLELPIVQ